MLVWLNRDGATAQIPAPALTPVGIDPEKAVTQYVYNNWSEEQGLTQGSPFAITQTPDGYLWLGTTYGLVRFDGVRFTEYSKKNTPELKGSDVKALAVDHEGALWLGTGGSGLLRLNDGKFTRYIADTSERHSIITALHMDSQQRLWVGTATGGLVWFDSTFGTMHQHPVINNQEVTALAEDLHRNLWVGTQTGLYCLRMNDSAMNAPLLYTAQQGLGEDFITALATDRTGALWVGTNSGLSYATASTPPTDYARLRFRTLTEKDGLSNNAVTKLYSDRQNTLWIGTNSGGLNRMVRGSITRITTAQGLSSNTILSLFEDVEGSLWIGAGGAGLDRIKTPKFSVFGKKEGFDEDIFSVVYEDSKGTLWTGSYFSNGVRRFTINNDGTPSIRNFDTADGLANAILSVCEDSEGRMWFGSFMGLTKYEQGKFTNYLSTEGLAHNNIRAVFQDSHGRLWLATYGGGLGRLRHDSLQTALTTAQGLSSDYLLGIAEDEEGRLWCATRDNGVSVVKPDSGVVAIYTFDTTKTPTPTQNTQALPGKSAYVVFRDAQQMLWIGTEAGVAIYRHGKFYHLTERQGMPEGAILTMQQDANGNYWFMSSVGIVLVYKQEVEAFIEGNISSVTTRIFNKSDGMRSIEYRAVGQPAAWAARDGSLWFCTMKGLVRVNPLQLRLNSLAPTVVIEELLVNEQSVNLHNLNSNGVLELPEGADRLTFRYTALSLLYPEKVRFKHKLEQFDSDWVDDREQRRANDYTSLLPGQYCFRVKACNNDGVWNEEGASITFYVAPKFYQTYWFYGIGFLLLAAIVALGFRFRIAQLQQRERELSKLVNERTKEIQRQVKILDEQATEIELANEELREKNALIEEERVKSERLLLNILPMPIADRLKSGERIIADKFESVTVMFADIVGFTNLSARISPEHLVENLSMIFTTFDALAAKYHVEKIKTIGDAYMVVGGLPDPIPNHAEAVALVALEMIESIADLTSNTDEPISVRIGMHTGPVVAGVIGIQKFAYDLWGDTVNTASRMESSGEPNKIQCTESTYVLLKDRFEFEERGEITVKGKGTMRTYFLLGKNEKQMT